MDGCQNFSIFQKLIGFLLNPKVPYLYEINGYVGICDNDLDFSIALFAKSLERRHNWLENKVATFLQGNNMSRNERERLEFLLPELKGHK